MVGTNPYHVVALPRRPAVSPCCLLPVPSAVCACVLLCRARVLLRQQCVGAAALALRSCVRACCVGRVRSVRPCVRAAASAAHGPFRGFRAFIPRWWETMVGSNPYHVVALPGRSGRPPRSPTDGFIDFGRLYPGGGKQWSAPTPTLLWRCDVGTVGARSVRSVCAASSVRSLRVRARCCVACACCWVCCAWARAAPSALLCVLLLLESN